MAFCDELLQLRSDVQKRNTWRNRKSCEAMEQNEAEAEQEAKRQQREQRKKTKQAAIAQAANEARQMQCQNVQSKEYFGYSVLQGSFTWCLKCQRPRSWSRLDGGLRTRSRINTFKVGLLATLWVIRNL